MEVDGHLFSFQRTIFFGGAMPSTSVLVPGSVFVAYAQGHVTVPERIPLFWEFPWCTRG